MVWEPSRIIKITAQGPRKFPKIQKIKQKPLLKKYNNIIFNIKSDNFNKKFGIYK